MKYFFEITGTVEADDQKEAEEKIKAGVGLEEIEIADIQEEDEVIPDDDEETTA